MKRWAAMSKTFARLNKDIILSIKEGGGIADPDLNARLRAVIQNCRAANMPKDNIERAIKKATDKDAADLKQVTFEGYGPHGIAVFVETATDNNNRTITDVRICFTKVGAKLGPTGSVSHQFDHLAVFSFKGDNEDQILEAMMEAEVDVDDIQIKDGQATLFAPAGEFYKAKMALAAAFPETVLEVQEISFIPQTTTEISADDLPTFERFIELLNDNEDVQDIYHNATLPG